MRRNPLAWESTVRIYSEKGSVKLFEYGSTRLGAKLRREYSTALLRIGLLSKYRQWVKTEDKTTKKFL